MMMIRGRGTDAVFELRWLLSRISEVRGPDVVIASRIVIVLMCR